MLLILNLVIKDIFTFYLHRSALSFQNDRYTRTPYIVGETRFAGRAICTSTISSMDPRLEPSRTCPLQTEQMTIFPALSCDNSHSNRDIRLYSPHSNFS